MPKKVETVICINCGQSFQRKCSALPKYCSSECKREYGTKQYRLRHPPELREQVCRQCGLPFLSLTYKRKYCSPACKTEADKASRTVHEKQCAQCGQSYRSQCKDQKFCSQKCRADAAKKPNTCQHCHKEFWCPDASRMKYCSRECWHEEQRRGAEERLKLNPRPEPIRYHRQCPECGQNFETNRQARKYCTADCQYRASLRFRRQKLAQEYTPRTFACRECGSIIEAAYGDMRSAFCCTTCERKHTRRSEHQGERYKARNKDAKRRREQQLAHRPGIVVDYDDVYKRDAGLCQICGLPVPYEKGTDNSWDATIDHVIPLSKGGSHSLMNCQLAHRICNSLKSDHEGFGKIDWQIKSRENNYWHKKYQRGLSILGLAER